jgi:DNA-binding response OmpR family regulator
MASTVLVIEDDHFVSEIINTVLQWHGYSVITSRSGAEALQAISTHGDSIQIIISDVNLPDIHYDLLSQALERTFSPESILWISGDPYAMDRTPGRHFLGKPFLLTVLLAKVRAMLLASKALTEA